MRYIATITLALCVSACGGWKDESYTVGSVCQAVTEGDPIPEGGERSTVWVGCPGCCTGTYIAPTVVLTAAHCGTPDSVGLGERASANVVLHVVHPDYEVYYKGNDMQLLFLDRELDREIATLGAGEYGLALIQGYGVQRDGTAGELMQGTTEVRRFISNPAGIEIGPGPDGCFGDSGGPLYQDGSLIGVLRQASRVSPTDNIIDSCGVGGIWTPVVTYKEWLDSEVDHLNWNSSCQL